MRQLLLGILRCRDRFGEALDLRGQVLLRHLPTRAEARDALAGTGGQCHGHQGALIEEEELLLDAETRHVRPQ